MRAIIQPAMLALSAILTLAVASAQAQQAAPELGRWITESGNLEVEIAACGPAYCGTITRVIAKQSMSKPGAAMAPAHAASPLGKQILFDLQPMSAGGWQGHIYNRENNKTYNSQLAALDPDQLKLTIYEDSPANGRVQVWRRSSLPVAR